MKVNVQPLSKAITDIIDEISSKEQYDEKYNLYLTSPAPESLKSSALRYMRAKFPKWDDTKIEPSVEVHRQIQAGSADIDDIGGN